jgi:hypothetical protein
MQKRGCRYSSVANNEDSDLELSGVGQSPRSSGASETKMDKRRIEKFRWMLGLTNLVFMECAGKSGGLALFLRSGVDVSLKAISKYYIDVDIAGPNDEVWRFTGIYGEPQTEKKDSTWAVLRNLNSKGSGPWGFQ